MSQIFEVVMLICFGMSWPISVVEGIKAKSTKGKSLFFILIIMVGYIAGIVSKVLKGETTYVFYLYIFNLLVVTLDCVVFVKNKKKEKNNGR